MQDRPRLWTAPFVGVALCNLALNIAGAFQIHLPGFLQQLGAEEAEIGSIMSTYAASALVAGPFVGRVMDLHGRSLVIRAGTVLFVLCTAAYLTIDRLSPFLYGLRLVEGVAGTMLYSSLFTYAADIVPPERRTEGIALFGASGLLPIGVSSGLGDVILSSAGYRGLFAAALGSALLALLFGWPLRDARHGQTQAPAGASAALFGTLGQRDLRPIWIAALAFFFGMSALMTFLKTYVLTTGHGSVGAFFLVYSGTALSLRVFLGWLPDRVGLRRMVLPALLAYGLGLWLLSRAESSTQVVLAAVPCGIGHGYAFPVLLSLVISRAPIDARGVAMAIYTSIDWAATLASGPIAGVLIERAGYPTTFAALAATLATGTALFYAFDRR